MKKTLLLAAASLLTYTAAFAQNGKQMLETIEETNIGDNLIFYYYNSDELVDSIVAVDYYGTTSKVFTYNDNNQVERIDCYSYNSFEFEKYSYILYGYNDEGQKIWRQNWNVLPEGSWDDRYDAEITYTYNPDGSLLSQVTYLLYRNSNTYERMDSTVYRYSSGRLGRTDCYTGDGSLNSYYTYSYDPRGNMETELNYMSVDGTSSNVEVYSKRAYEYDRSGNLKEVVYYLANSSSEFSIPQDSTSYVYDTSVSADNLVYPIDPEEPEDYEPYLKSQLNGYSIYNLEEYDMKLALTQVFVYNWGDFHPLGVDKAMTAEGSDVKVYVSGGTAFILGLEDKGCDYAIYDMMGRTVLSGQLAGGTVDVCPLHDGYYILSVDGHNVKFRR